MSQATLQLPPMPDLRGPVLLRGLASLGFSGPVRRWQDWQARTWQYQCQRQYLEAAASNSKTAGWKKITAEPDIVARTDNTTATARAIHLVTNTPYAAKAANALTDLVVGQGIRRDIRIRWSKDQAVCSRHNSALEDRLKRFQDVAFIGSETHLFDAQRLWLRDTAQAGETLLRTLYRPNAPILPLRFQLVARDQLSSYGTTGSQKGNEILGGIEYDADGQIVAYHIHKGGYLHKTERVEAPFVHHKIRVDRPGQTRGVTWFASIVTMLNMLQELTEYKIIQAKVQSALAVILSDSPAGDGPAAPSLPTPAGGTKTDTTTAAVQQFITPGMIHKVGQGSVSTLTPTPSGDFDPLVKTMLRACAVGFNLSYERLSGDYREVSFAGGRLVENTQKDATEGIWAWQCRGPERFIHRAWIDAETTFHGLPAPLPRDADPYAVNFSRPRWRLGTNPLQEAKAATELLAHGQTSISDELASRGLCLDDLIESLKTDRDKFGSIGVQLFQLLGLAETEAPKP